MPETLSREEVEKGIDPSVSKQLDNDVSSEKKFEDFYAIADKLKISLLGTFRESVGGPVARSMAVAKRSGPDILYLANRDSQKFKDLEKVKVCTVTFQNSSNQDWVSISGEAVTLSNDDPRIKEIWSQGTRAWFGDLGDGIHTGGPEDPRMKLIEIKSKYISYWKAQVGALGFGKEVVGAIVGGGVANTGALRMMEAAEIEEARARDSKLTSS